MDRLYGKVKEKSKRWSRDYLHNTSAYPGQNGQRWNQAPPPPPPPPPPQYQSQNLYNPGLTYSYPPTMPLPMHNMPIDGSKSQQVYGQGSQQASTQYHSPPGPPPLMSRPNAGTLSLQNSSSSPPDDYLKLQFPPQITGKTRSKKATTPLDTTKSPLISNVDFLGPVRSTTTYIKRDLGFSGRLGSYILLSYGDTMYSDSEYTDKWRGMTCNSVALATHDPLAVHDSNIVVRDDGRYPEQWVPCHEEWGEEPSCWAVGITNVIETGEGEGILYYLLNHRPQGNNNLIGAGIARVFLDSSIYPPRPTAHRISRFIWSGDHEPWFGDVCSLLHPSDNHIYAYGHKKDNPWVYLARVHVANACDVNCYEYWHGQNKGWKQDRLYERKAVVSPDGHASVGDDTRVDSDKGSNAVVIGEEQSVFWQVNQGQVIWNEYLDKFLFVYCDNFWSSTIIIRHADKPEGPWSDPIDAYKATPITAGGTIYAAAPQPHFDPSGQTLIVSFTNHPNRIEVVKIWF